MKHLLHTRAYVTPRRVSDEDLANRWLLLIHQLPPKPSLPAGASLAPAPGPRGRSRSRTPSTCSRTPRRARGLRVGAARDRRRTAARRRSARRASSTGCATTRCEALFKPRARRTTARSTDGGAGAASSVRSRDGRKQRPATTDRRRRGAPPEPPRRRRRRIDFFGAPGREAARGTRSRRARTGPGRAWPASAAPVDPTDLRGRTWVTRKGIHIDRIASAWLVRRFIDPTGALQVRPGARATARSPASSASTCSTPSSPTTATSAPSRCCSRDFGLDDRGAAARSPRSSTTSTSRTRSSIAGDRGHRPPDRRPLPWPTRDDEARLARGGARLRRPLRLLPEEERS